MAQNIKYELNKLMQKDMDRKDFLKHVGIGFAGIMGITSALKTLTNLNGGTQQTEAYGYGSGAYGGRKRSIQNSNS